MTFLCEHRSEARAMGAAGRARVEALFSEEAMVARYDRLYQDVTGGMRT
jgi:hypothetical protein